MNFSNTVLRTTDTFNNNRANAYVVNEVWDASPQKLLLKVYDFAIMQCKNKNLEKTNKALMELINALRFDSEEVSEISLGLKKLYEYCQEQMRQANYDQVIQILTELRETWSIAFIKK